MKQLLTTTLAMLLMLVASASAATEIVSSDTAAGENMPGWLFNRDVSTSTPFEFNMDEASIGDGALYVLPIGANAADKFIGEYFPGSLYVNELSTFSYDFLIGPNGVDTQEEQFYLNVYTNFGESDDDKYYDCRYDIVPTVGSTSDWTTVTFDPTQAYPVTTRGGASASPYACPAVPADMDSLSPGSNIRAFAVTLGDTSASDVGLDGYFDNVVVTRYPSKEAEVAVNAVQDYQTVFDFEPERTPEVPEFGSILAIATLGIIGTAFVARKRN